MRLSLWRVPVEQFFKENGDQVEYFVLVKNHLEIRREKKKLYSQIWINTGM